MAARGLRRARPNGRRQQARRGPRTAGQAMSKPRQRAPRRPAGGLARRRRSQHLLLTRPDRTARIPRTGSAGAPSADNSGATEGQPAEGGGTRSRSTRSRSAKSAKPAVGADGPAGTGGPAAGAQAPDAQPADAQPADAQPAGGQAAGAQGAGGQAAGGAGRAGQTPGERPRFSGGSAAATEPGQSVPAAAFQPPLVIFQPPEITQALATPRPAPPRGRRKPGRGRH